MNQIIKSYRIVYSVKQCSVSINTLRKICFKQSIKLWIDKSNIAFINSRSMSQKSITSFFKITPKKETDVKVEKHKIDTSPTSSPSNKESEISPVTNGKKKKDTSPTSSLSNKEVESNISPVTNAKKKKKTSSTSLPSNKQIEIKTPLSNGKKGKQSSKRQRLDSSDSGTQSPLPKAEATSPATPEKKKTKRRRIVSSGSESESSTPDSQPEIKVEKTAQCKTYDSPKNRKKQKMGKTPLTEKNNKSPSTSPVIKEKVEVKEDKSSIKKEIKKATGLSAFIKRESASEKKVSESELATGKKDNVVKVLEAEYNPAKPKYHPINDACWSKGEAVPYLALARTLELIEATSARLKMIDILANYFRSVIVLTPEDLLPSMYMCLNQLAPAYHSLELGVAETYLMKAVGQSTGRTVAQVRAAARKEGDLGAVAASARQAQRTMCTPRALTARNVFGTLKEIAHMTGHASVNKKINKIQSLYIACRHSEAKYLIRSLEGKLRVGLAEQSALHALALAAALTPPGGDTLDASKGLSQEAFKAIVDEHVLLVKTTYCECPDYGQLIPALLQYGARALPQHCRLTPGVPLKPMLAHPTRGIQQLFARFENEEFTCEWKYDGERAQIHVPSIEGEERPDCANAAIFSRNQENNTSKYPDVLGRLGGLLGGGVTSCVLDAEVVAYDVANKKILPFQILSTRKRKDAVESEISVRVCVYLFDLLYLNGAPLVREPLLERRRLLREHFAQVEGEWQFATGEDCGSLEEVAACLERAVSDSCEGLMVKALKGDKARYDIARRSHNWLKLKKDYLEGAGDTIDAVVVGAWWGRGKRAGLLGGFLVAARDAESEELQSLCKLGTGFSDADLNSLTETLKKHIIDAPKSYYRYDSAHLPDVWVEATCVWEIRCADLSLSPAHRAAIGLVDPDKGISLRFPRFLRVREDKTPEEATTAQQIAEMYLGQDQIKNQAPRTTNLDDFY